MGIIVISASVILLALTILWGVFATKKFISNIYFQNGMVAANVNGDVDSSEANIKTAIKFDENDLYYRTLSQINLIKLNQISVQKDVEEKVLQEQFRNTLGKAIDNAKKRLI